MVLGGTMISYRIFGGRAISPNDRVTIRVTDVVSRFASELHHSHVVFTCLFTEQEEMLRKTEVMRKEEEWRKNDELHKLQELRKAVSPELPI